MREWMDANLPRWLLGLINWPNYRFVGRCWAMGCGLPMFLHTPWRLYDCERTPMAISITDKGMERLRRDAMAADLPDTDWQLEQVVPVHQ
jgi:hypothetical protein